MFLYVTKIDKKKIPAQFIRKLFRSNLNATHLRLKFGRKLMLNWTLQTKFKSFFFLCKEQNFFLTLHPVSWKS